jgi:ABC-type multidrug transport system fused ATPase/permease subunit
MVAYGGIIALCLLMMTPEGLTSGNALSSILPMLGVFALAGQRVLAELSKLYRGMTQMNYGAAAVENLHSTLQYSNSALKLVETSNAPLGIENCLEFRNISYRYPGTTNAGVTDLSFRVNVGEKIGIVGSTGSGKSTLADIMLGLLTSSEGLILVDGSIINSGNIHSWQRTIGYVPQQIYLIDASVIENIALGIAKENINFDRVRNSAKIAQIDHFISNDLPNGYDTAIGERGMRLSGGQRQRIGIARAIYQQTDILLLDEATSALDNKTEADLIRAITSAPKNMTVITIAHRTSTVEFCDRILVMNEGRLVGSGTWDELQKNNPFHKETSFS